LLTEIRVPGSPLQIKGITADFSLSGLQLRISGNREVPSGATVEVDIFPPSTSVEEFESQKPLTVSANVVWCRKEGAGFTCGLDFVALSAAQQRGIESCFAHFKKNPRFEQRLPGSRPASPSYPVAAR
jgi:methyl-accepting chemotaxis protein